MIELPLFPGPSSLAWQHIDYGRRLIPALGGPVTRINRLGNRFSVAVTLPPMVARDGMRWVAALNQAVQQGVRWKVRQPDFEIGVPGKPVVDGGGQAGTTLAIRNAQPFYPFRVGQVVAVGGRLAMIAEQSLANASGQAALSLTAPLRAEPVNGETVEVATPLIEGLLEGDGFPWTVDLARHWGLSFAIAESR